MKKNRVFLETSNLETQTVFRENGCIDIYPCDFERDQHLLAGSKDTVSQRGRMTTEDDGTSHFKPYREGGGSQYTTLWVEPHATLSMTKNKLVLKVSVPLKDWHAMSTLESEAKACFPRFTDGHVVDRINLAIMNANHIWL